MMSWTPESCSSKIWANSDSPSSRMGTDDGSNFSSLACDITGSDTLDFTAFTKSGWCLNSFASRLTDFPVTMPCGVTMMLPSFSSMRPTQMPFTH